MKRRAAYFLILIFTTTYSFSQAPWETEANAFLNRYYDTDLKSLNGGTLDSAIINTTQFILGAAYNSSSDILSELYVARAKLQFEKWERRKDALNSNLNQSDDLYSMIEHDYKKAATYGESCECSFIGDLEDFYEESENEAKLKEVQTRMTELGINDELPMSLGVGLNYIGPKNIVGAELTFIATTALFPKKSIHPSTGKKYRPCGYMYPRAFGFLSLGYEVSASESFDRKKYDGVKFNAFWFNYFVSLRLSQFLYCNSSAGNSLVWRPEIGYSFSTLSVNYALNLPFKSTFNYLPLHTISIRFIIPAVKLE